jgi:hypothetical protein
VSVTDDTFRTAAIGVAVGVDVGTVFAGSAATAVFVLAIGTSTIEALAGAAVITSDEIDERAATSAAAATTAITPRTIA